MIDTIPSSQESTIGHLLVKISRLVGGRMRAKLEAFGLHHAQGMILFHLWQHEGMAQNSLAQALHITPPTTTSTLQRMERDGWIKRRRDSKDQRVVRVYPREKARALREELRRSFMELDRELMSVLSADERDALMELLTKIHAYLSPATETPHPSHPPNGHRNGDPMAHR
jgi:MarR family transcriptional regulator, organic hydroperoxide resistance regulator